MPSNGRPARGTMRAWRDDRLVAWNAADTNVQKTSKPESEDEERAFEDEVQSVLQCPLLRLIEAQKISA